VSFGPIGVMAVTLLAAAGMQDTGWMSEADLKTTFGGAEIDGHYSTGAPFTEKYMDGGRLEYTERGLLMGGRWSVQTNQFCTIYDRNMSGGCFQVKRAGVNCYEFYFIARTEEKAKFKPDEPSWTAQAWRKDKPGSCKEQQTVEFRSGVLR
jgi:hypothetical protein